MPDALSRLVGPVQLGAVAAEVRAAVPAATQVTLRHLHVVNTTAAAVTFRLSIGADADGTRLWHDQSVAPGVPFDWSGHVVLNTGDALQAYASAAASLTLTASGVVTT